MLKFSSFFLLLGLFWQVTAQLSATELEPLLAGLKGLEDTSNTPVNVEKRVPLSTNDPTTAPSLISKFLHPQQPPVAVLVVRFNYYNTLLGIGTQYDRLSVIFLSHVEIMRHSSVEPTKTGTYWSIVKDVTYYSPLFAQEGDFMFEFSNIIAPELLLDGVFNVTVVATFYAPTTEFKTPKTSDLILPLSNLSPTAANYFSINDDLGAATNVTLPQNTTQAFVEVYCSGNSAEEFWYTNTPDDFLDRFPASTGLIGKGPFREVQVWVEDKLAGVVWPYPVFYTGGVTPSMWRPLSSYGAFDQPSYFVDITPFIPIMLSRAAPSSITLRVLGQGKNPTINANWFVSGSIHSRQGKGKTTGHMKEYSVGNLSIRTTGGASANNASVWTSVRASRSLRITSELQNSEGKQIVSFEQNLQYTNDQRYANQGWIQFANQTTTGTTTSRHGSKQVLRDAFTYPVKIASDYSKYTWEFGAYGAEVNQTYERALLHPTSFYRAIQSIQHARGDVGMDNWPGLRHAINGSGYTEQTFAYADGRSNDYFREIAAKNDGWLRDKVWGSLRAGNPPVPAEQIWPNGGPGFRR